MFINDDADERYILPDVQKSNETCGINDENAIIYIYIYKYMYPESVGMEPNRMGIDCEFRE